MTQIYADNMTFGGIADGAQAFACSYSSFGQIDGLVCGNNNGTQAPIYIYGGCGYSAWYYTAINTDIAALVTDNSQAQFNSCVIVDANLAFSADQNSKISTGSNTYTRVTTVSDPLVNTLGATGAFISEI